MTTFMTEVSSLLEAVRRDPDTQAWADAHQVTLDNNLVALFALMGPENACELLSRAGDPEFATSGAGRILLLMRAHAEQLLRQELQVTVNWETLRISCCMPGWGHDGKDRWILLATEEAAPTAGLTVTNEALEAARYTASVLTLETDTICTLLPELIFDDGGTRTKRLVEHQVNIDGETRGVSVLAGPTLAGLVMPDPEEVQAERGCLHWQFIAEWCAIWRSLVNFCTRTQKDTRGVPYGEPGIADRVLGAQGLKNRLFGRTVEERFVPGQAIFGLQDVYRRLVNPRVEGSTYGLITGDPRLGHFEISFPAALVARMAKESLRRDTPMRIDIGTKVLMTRRPMAMPPVLTVTAIHHDSLAIYMSPWLAEAMESDFDGDCASFTMVPQELLPEEQSLNRLFEQFCCMAQLFEYSLPTACVDQTKAGAALAGPAKSKMLMGMATILWRVVCNTVLAFRHIDLSNLTIDEVRSAKALGEPVTLAQLQPFMAGVHDFGTAFGRIFMEAAISKRIHIDIKGLQEILDRAHRDPYGATKMLVDIGEIFADNKRLMLLLCLWLNTLPAPFTKLVESASPQRRFLLAPSHWSGSWSAVLQSIHEHGVSMLFD